MSEQERRPTTIWEDGEYTVQFKWTDTSFQYGPQISILAEQLKGPDVGAVTFFNMTLTDNPTARRIFKQRLEKLGVSETELADIVRVLGKEKGFAEIATRLRGVIAKVNVTKKESKKHAGKYNNFFEVVEVLKSADDEGGEAESTTPPEDQDVLDLLGI